MPSYRNISTRVDWPLVIAISLLCFIGLFTLYSAGFNQATGESLQMKKQAISMAIGLVFFTVCMLFSPAFWQRYAYLIYVVGCLLLAAIFFTGVVAGGARRWLDFGGVRMQPSEFMKVALILALAKLFSNRSAPLGDYRLSSLFAPFVLMAIPVALIVVEPDLGTALCHLLIGGSMLLLAGLHRKTLLTLLSAGLLLTIPFWLFGLKDYQRQRILTFMSPESDPLGSGYHAIQSKIAVGSGAFWGKGFMEGTQTQLRFLPEQTTDFIFSVLAEEWGFVGTFLVIFLYGFLIFRLLSISSRCQDAFSAFVAFGVASLIFWHVLVNIGMVVGVLPVVGLTLPLLSFGGSSVTSVMAALGLAAGFSFRRFLF